MSFTRLRCANVLLAAADVRSVSFHYRGLTVEGFGPVLASPVNGCPSFVNFLGVLVPKCVDEDVLK